MTDSRREMPTPINQRAMRATTVSMVLALSGGILAVAASIADWSDRIFGIGIAGGLFGIGFALVAWSKALQLDEEVVQEREPLRLSATEIQALDEEASITADTVGRRPLLLGLFGGSVVALLAAILSPILSLGPGPGGSRKRTSWTAGRRVVTSDGEPILAERAALDQLATVFPEGHTDADDSQVVLLRVRPELIAEDTKASGAVDGWIAYSKICTHLGCSVGLFGVDDRPPDTIRQLVCPCHQSIFDPLDGAKPVGGPAPRPLPQLPLAIDDEGFLIATADFDTPVGPATWDEG